MVTSSLCLLSDRLAGVRAGSLTFIMAVTLFGFTIQGAQGGSTRLRSFYPTTMRSSGVDGAGNRAHRLHCGPVLGGVMLSLEWSPQQSSLRELPALIVRLRFY